MIGPGERVRISVCIVVVVVVVVLVVVVVVVVYWEPQQAYCIVLYLYLYLFKVGTSPDTVYSKKKKEKEKEIKKTASLRYIDTDFPVSGQPQHTIHDQFACWWGACPPFTKSSKYTCIKPPEGKKNEIV